tara:strand:+ start:642 stop:4994 length:4353 start_codon:yes stop_codon:yes gene_type:complete
MATDLTNVAVSTGFTQLLHIDGGIGGSVNRIYDGDGTGSPLEISSTTVQIKDGSFDFNVSSHDGTNGLKLGGTLVTASATELNYVDVSSIGTAEASKAIILDSNKDITGIRNLTATGTITASNFIGSGNTTIGDAVTDTIAINSTITTDLIFEGSTANDFELTLTPGDPTADRTITLPDATDQLVGRATTDTLTNKGIDADNNTLSNIEVDNLKSGVLDTDISSVSGSDDTIASAKAIKTYVDAQVTAQDLDFQGDSGGALSIDLDSETLDIAGDGAGISTAGSGNQITISGNHDALTNFVANEHIDHSSVTLTAGNGLSGGGDITTSRSFAVDLNELATETSIADDDFIAMVDATDNGSGKITFENLEDAIFASVSGDIAIAEDGTATIQANSVAMATDTTGDFVNSITAGTGITSTGATSGENISHSLSVDAAQTQITSVGTLNAGAISSGFGAIDIGSSNFTTTGTIDISGGTLTLADNQISGNKVEGGTIAAVTISALTTAGISASTDLDIGSHGFRASTLTADSQTSGRVAIYGANGLLTEDSDLTFSGSTLSATNVNISGTLTTTGSVQEVSTTNLNVEDPLILLNKYDSQPSNNAFDAGIVIKRGSSDSAPANVAFIFDESANQFALIDTDEDGTTAGNVNITDYENLRIGALTADDASTFTSTISAATGSTIGNLTFANGSITDSSGAISFGNENLSTSGTLGAGAITGTSFIIGSASISEAELEILDGANITTAELNIIDGDTSATSTTVADADRVVMNDNGTMVQVAVTDLAAYFDDEITAMPNLVTSGTLNSGAISSGFGNIDIGSSNLTATGSVSLGTTSFNNNSITGVDSFTVNDIGSNTAGDVTFISAVDFDNSATTNVNIDSGAIDGTPIGANSASTGAFTTITGSYSNSSGTDYLDGDAGLYLANSGSDGTIIKFGDTNAGLVYGGSGTGTFKLMQRENTVLSFDASRNATFAGKLTVDKSISAGDLNTAPIVTFKNSQGSGHYTAIKFEGADSSGANTGFLGYMSHNTASTRRFVFSHDGTTRHAAFNGDGSVIFKGSGDSLTLESTNSGTGGAQLNLNHIGGSQADGDSVGRILFNGQDSNDNAVTYARIDGIAEDVTDGSENGALNFDTRTSNSAFSTKMRITSDGEIQYRTTGDDHYSSQVEYEGNDDIKLHFGPNYSFESGFRKVLTLDNQKVGIGIENVAYTFQVVDSNNNGSVAFMQNNYDGTVGGTMDIILGFKKNDGNFRNAAIIRAAKDDIYTTNTQADGRLEFHTTLDGSSTERMRITSDGHILNGVTSITDTSSRDFGNAFSGSSSYGNWTSWGSGSHTHAIFRNGTSIVGTITTTSSGTAYNNLSDYRLKENEVVISDGLTRLNQLKPYRFNFKTDTDTTVDGFFAHEVAEVVPEAVTGKKDAVDDDGNIVSQGIDQSKLVPLLVKAVQELSAKVEALENA